MIQWNEQQKQIRSMIRRFIETEIAPKLDQYEHGDTPPYDVLRKFAKTFGLQDMAKGQFKEAEEAFTEALRIEPKRARTMALLGEMYTRAGDLKRAESQLRQALAIDSRLAGGRGRARGGAGLGRR